MLGATGRRETDLDVSPLEVPLAVGTERAVSRGVTETEARHISVSVQRSGAGGEELWAKVGDGIRR